MKKIGIIANCGKKRAPAVLRRVAQLARKHRLQLFTDQATGRLLTSAAVLPVERFASTVSAIVALGGDGTMLRVVRDLGDCDRPVMGVNIGGLGFLTTVSEGELGRAMAALARGQFSVRTRAVAEAVVRSRRRVTGRYRALNEIVVSNTPSPRTVLLDLWVDGDRVTSYVCDGIIVSTPTGSTGHSLSAGGPILVPETPAFVISLICPHTLSSRPLVVPDRSVISIRVTESEGAASLVADGQVGQALEEGDCIEIRRSRRCARFIHLPDYTYFDVLRQKLNWKGSNVR